MGIAYHDDLVKLLRQWSNVVTHSTGVADVFEVPWPSSNCSRQIQEGMKSRVAKNWRPSDIRLQLGPLDAPSPSAYGFNEFAESGVEGYWSSRIKSTGRSRTIPQTGVLGEEYQPVMNHVVAASRDEGYFDRELKRLAIFRTKVTNLSAVLYLYECLLRAFTWKGDRQADSVQGASSDKSRLGQRFVSIMLSDLWTFPVPCVREIEHLVIEEGLGSQHFDAGSALIKHSKYGKCSCVKLRSLETCKSYIVFSSEKFIPYILKLLKSNGIAKLKSRISQI